MSRTKERSSLDCIPSVEVVQMELARKRREAEALEYLLGVSQEVEKRRSNSRAGESRESEVAHVG
jgi:hypothetical protein